MPEFRFRRKKKKQQSSRRHTVHDPEEAHAQVVAAREMVTREELANRRTRSPSLDETLEPNTMATAPEGGHKVSTGTLAREREKFFDLLRTKYPEHDKGIEEFLSVRDKTSEKRGRYSRSQSADLETMLLMGDEERGGKRGGGGGGESGEGGERQKERGGGREMERKERRGRETERRREKRGRDKEIEGEPEREMGYLSSSDARDVSSEIEQHYGGCFFLRHGTVLRRCPIPSPITLSTLKNLLVNTFDLPASLLNDPMCYVMIQDRGTMRWKPLTNISDIYDHCILQLADPDAPVTNPTHFLPESALDDHLHSSSESPPLITTNHTTITAPHLAHHHYNHSSHHAAPAVHSPPATRGLNNSTHTTHTEKSLWSSDSTNAIPVSPPHPPPLTPHHHTHHITTTQFGSPHSVTSSTSGVCSESLQMSLSPQRLSRHVRVIQRHVQELREDFETYRKEQLADITDFSLSLRDATYKITAAIRGQSRIAVLEQGVTVEPFRRQRLELSAEKEAYSKSATETFLEVSILETAVEDIRRDVVERRCRVHGREVDGLVGAVQNTLKALKLTKDQYFPLETKIRRVMERELTEIVEEENFVQEEGPRLEDAGEKCRKLAETLETLKQVAAVQLRRTPLIPHFNPVENPDRNALMENIKAVTPNHMHRLESIEMAKCVQEKKKELVMQSEGIKRFESQLRVQKDHLHKMDSVPQLEERQEKKMIALYMSEKAQHEEELAKEMKWERKVAERKRKEERERVKERLVQKQREDEKKKKRQIERKKARSEGDQSSQSIAGEESAEWYSGCEEGDSLHISSSFSSTASLLEHVRSMSGWSSDTTQQEKYNKTEETSGTQRRDFLTDSDDNITSKQCDKSTSGCDPSGAKASALSTTQHTSSTPGLSEQNHTKTTQQKPSDKGGDHLPTHPHPPPPQSHRKLLNKVKHKENVPQPNTAIDQKKSRGLPSSSKGHQFKRKHESPQHKKDLSKQTQLKNTETKTKAAIQPPTTNSTAQKPVIRASHTGLSQEMPQQPFTRINHRQPTNSPGARGVHNRTSKTAPGPARRVASSDTLLEPEPRPANTHYHNGPVQRPLFSGTSLADASPKLRKSIAYLGEFEDQAGVYDTLEKKEVPAVHIMSQHQAAVHTNKLQGGKSGLRMPTFPDRRPESVLGIGTQQPPVLYDPPVSNSQPDRFDFSSNPSYDTGPEVKQNIRDSRGRKPRKDPTGEAGAEKGFVTANHNGHVVQSQIPQSHPQIHQQPPNHGHGVNPKSGKTSVVHLSYSTKPNPVVIKPTQTRHASKVQPGHSSSNPAWQYSESDSSETERIRSVLSDHSGTRRSTLSTVSGKQSNSSDFSSGGHSEAINSHQVRPQKVLVRSPPPHVQGSQSRPLQGGNPKNHSGLPAPRKRHHTRHHEQQEGSTARGHRRVAPQPPPHRQTNRIPHTQSKHNEAALTSYPRFQQRDDHRIRLQARTRGHNTRQLGVIPGTGQLAQVTRTVTEPTTTLHQSSRKPDLGSLV